jgi:hypothetical protein
LEEGAAAAAAAAAFPPLAPSLLRPSCLGRHLLLRFRSSLLLFFSRALGSSLGDRCCLPDLALGLKLLYVFLCLILSRIGSIVLL